MKKGIFESSFALLLFALLAPAPIQADDEQAKSLSVETQFLGDISYRSTDFSRVDYESVVGWTELRAVLRYKALVNDRVLRSFLFEPYVKGTLAASENSYFWENNFAYGPGLENRFLEEVTGLDDSRIAWMKNIRLYVEYLAISYGDVEIEKDTPDHDLRAGIDLWKEWNIPPLTARSNIWGEVWGNASWRETNFSKSDYQTYVCGLMGRVGPRFSAPVVESEGILLDLLPYVILEASTTGTANFWENGYSAGGGVRLMPVFKWGKDRDQQLILRIYAEWLTNLGYFKGEADPETPDHDVRVGINFSYNLR